LFGRGGGGYVDKHWILAFRVGYHIEDIYIEGIRVWSRYALGARYTGRDLFLGSMRVIG
jgi:hypothetical protein